jgi:uncharacterized lipoprotein YehR (DUF1307 family)
MKRLFVGLMALVIPLSLAGCGKSEDSEPAMQGAYDNEILTTTAVSQDKTLITVRVENNVAQAGDIETVLEQQFPKC